MAADDPLLLNIAGAILDGTEPDWPSLESSASESQRAVFAELKAVAAIGSLRRREPVLPVAAPPRPLEGLDTWGTLRVLEPVGHGGFGTVYRAWDPNLDREVALKLLPADADAVAALGEGKLLAKVRHGNVVTIFGADRIDDYVGLWMEFVHGETLDHQVKAGGRFDPVRVAAIGRQLCHALAAVHAAGLIHRDVKAHNVMVEPGGRLVLMDFGAGRALAGDAGDVAGTPLYLAPEIFDGRAATPRSDLYSTGVLLHYLLTGAYPIPGRTLRDVRDAHRRGTPIPSVGLARPDAPRSLTSAIDRALALDPDQRFASAEDMASALELPAPRITRAWKIAALVTAAGVASLIAAVSAGIVSLPFSSGKGPGAAAAVAGANTPSTRRLSLPDAQLVGGGLSRDGHTFAYLGGEGLVAFDMRTGTVETLVMAEGEQFAEFCVTAPDGSQVAYQWWTDRGAYELRVVDRRTRHVRTLVRDDTLDQVLPVEWSRDGSALLAWTKSLDGRGRIAVIDVASGGVETVREIDTGTPLGLSLSGDGRFIAYDLPMAADRAARTLHIVDRGGREDRQIATAASANDRFPLWTPDGRHLFFISDRSGSADGWVVPVEDGVTTGEPSLAVRNLGRVSSLGLTDDGGFYYRLTAGAFEVNRAVLDSQTHALGSPARVAGRFTASNIGPAYAPDGRRLSYISVRDALGGTPVRTVVVKDLVSGDERELNPPFEVGNSPARWSPEGRRLLIASRIVDAASGALLHAFNPHPAKDTSSYGPTRWDINGTSVVFEREGVGLVRHPLDGSADVPVYRYSPGARINRVHRFEVSPDGQHIALSAFLRGGGTVLEVVSAGGEVELARRTPPEMLTVQGWSPDGASILYTTLRTNAPPPHELWRMAITGGEPERLGAINGATQINPVAVSPTGKAIAFTTGTPLNEIWMMEHFLP